MLNELKALSDSIRAAGISGDDWDDKFKEIKVKGSPCFVVSLSDEGEIADIRFLAPEKAKVLRTWQGGSNGECFPSFNFLPFYEVDEDKVKWNSERNYWENTAKEENNEQKTEGDENGVQEQ